MLTRTFALFVLLAFGLVAGAASPKSIAEATIGMKRIEGLLPLYWNAAEGQLFLEVPQLHTDLLYTYSLPYGIGSNDLGLDRGQINPGRIVRFERNGRKIFLVQPNQNFRSSAADASEQLAVRQSFPDSILYGFTIAVENPGGASGGVSRLVVDGVRLAAGEAAVRLVDDGRRHSVVVTLGAAQAVLP